MNTPEIREQLRNYIDKADEQHLQAIYTLLKSEIVLSNEYDVNTLEMLYQRRNNYMQGSTKTFTVEELVQEVRLQKPKH